MELCAIVACRYMRRHSVFKILPKIWQLNCLRTEHQLNINSDKNNDISQRSTLFVAGRYSSDIYQIVKPFIDANYIEENLERIKHSSYYRGIESHVKDVIPLLRNWEVLKNEHADLAKDDAYYTTEMDRLRSLGLTFECDEFHRRREEWVDKIKIVKEKVYEVEDIIMPILSSIPNFLDDSTPLEADEVKLAIEAFNVDFPVASHVEVSKKNSLLQFCDLSPTAYYLTADLCNLELAIEAFFREKIMASGFAPLSGTDFCKSFIVEATGQNPYSPNDCIVLKDKNARETGQKLNLVGCASLESFCAYLTNMNINKFTLEAKYFSGGRRYTANYKPVSSPDLFSAVQSSNVHCLVLCDNKFESAEFGKLFQVLLSCYTDLNIPFRTVEVAARNLNTTESRRKRIELWSPSQSSYVPVAHVSQRGDFVSRRLNITYGVDHVVEGFCSMVEGVAVNASVVIGCILENFQKPDYAFEIPEILKDYFIE